MFRNSDERGPKYHETYTNKPKSQTLPVNYSDATVIDEMYNRDAYATINDKQPAPIPTSYEYCYDPQNPKADWSGTVKLNTEEKKHNYQNHKCTAINIEQTEDGIVSVLNKKYDFHKKKIEAPNKDSGKTLIGGITSDDPFKTTYTRLTQGDTSQLSTNHRTKGQVLSQQLSDSTAVVRKSNTNDANSTLKSSNVNEKVSFHYESQRALGKSLLSNIGASVAPRLS